MRDLLQHWERCAALGPWDRDDMLLSDGPKPTSIGERNGALLELRAKLFGRHWPLRSDCPACGAWCEFEIDVDELVARAPQIDTSEARRSLPIDGVEHSFRLPDAADLRAISRCESEEAAIELLARRCLGLTIAESLPSRTIDAFAQAVEQADPNAVIGLAMCCPACGHHWTSNLDVADVMWTELRVAAERALLDIHTLATTYGWTEEQVLSLNPVRRGAYVQMATASGERS